MAREGKPTLYVVAGPEGAGKTTFHQLTLQALTKGPVISADKVQDQLLGENGQRAIGAGNLIAHQQAREMLPGRREFIYETTFADRRDVQLVNEAKEEGYRVVMFHVQTRSPELSVERVVERVKEGGRDVPAQTVRLDYARAPALIREAARNADLTFAYDSSTLNQAPRHVLSLERGQLTNVAENLPQWARQTYARELMRETPERQSAAAASFVEANTIVQRLAGKDATLGIAGHEPGTLRGAIVAESQHHVVQQTGEKSFVAHFKDRLAVRTPPGQEVKITYAATRDLGSIEFGPQRVPRTQPLAAAEARAYIERPRGTALKEYPGLAGAYASEDSLKGVADRARPVNDAVAGAALHALKNYGAVYGRGVGPQGRAYAIPTKKTPYLTLPLSEIRGHVGAFMRYAREHPEQRFLLTKIGCGLAGYPEREIAPMFREAPPNVMMIDDAGQLAGAARNWDRSVPARAQAEHFARAVTPRRRELERGR